MAASGSILIMETGGNKLARRRLQRWLDAQGGGAGDGAAGTGAAFA
jgi:hypothetical protein